MPYATHKDLTSRYREAEILALAAPEGAAEIIGQALADASAEVDTWLRARYATPVAAPPADLVRISADIAVYRLATAVGAMTEERRTRYRDAILDLKAYAEGGKTLDAPAAEASGGEQRIRHAAEPRVFTFERLRSY